MFQRIYKSLAKFIFESMNVVFKYDPAVNSFTQIHKITLLHSKTKIFSSNQAKITKLIIIPEVFLKRNLGLGV